LGMEVGSFGSSLGDEAGVGVEDVGSRVGVGVGEGEFAVLPASFG